MPLFKLILFIYKYDRILFSNLFYINNRNKMKGLFMSIKKIGLSAITVSDIKKSSKFFSDIGLKVKSNHPEFGWCEFTGLDDGNILGVGQSDGSMKPGTNAVVSLTVQDIVKSKADLESKGVKFISEIMEVPGEVKLVLFKDLDGNVFYLAQELRTAKK